MSQIHLYTGKLCEDEAQFLHLHYLHTPAIHVKHSIIAPFNFGSKDLDSFEHLKHLNIGELDAG